MWKSRSSVPTPNASFPPAVDRSVRIWDVAGDKVLHVLTGHTAPVTSGLFSPDGKFVASAGGDRAVKIWDADTGKHLRDLAGQGTVAPSYVYLSRLFPRRQEVGVRRCRPQRENLGLRRRQGTGRHRRQRCGTGRGGLQPRRQAAGHRQRPRPDDQTVTTPTRALKLQVRAGRAHGVSVSGLAYSPDACNLLALAAPRGTDQTVKARVLDRWPNPAATRLFCRAITVPSVRSPSAGTINTLPHAAAT